MVGSVLTLLLWAGAAAMVGPPGVGVEAARALPAPSGWEITRTAGGTRIVWHSAAPLPAGGAAPEFRVADRLLGHPRLSADLRRLSLTTTGRVAPADLQVWLSGRRLDAAGSTPARRAVPYAAPGGAARTLPVDPGEPGPFATETSDYALDPVRVPDLPLPVELAGHVVAPVDAPGARPLVLLLHGRHPSCYLPGTDQAQIVWPCPDGWEQVPNHRGYRYLQRLLASQGYVTVSITANAVDGQETFAAPDLGAAARAALVRRHLATWAGWAADPGSEWSGRVDPTAVTLVGHSRGGEAVDRVAVGLPDSAPYDLDGLVLLAPTNFGRQAAPGLPTVTLVGYCDGDVTDLAGAGYADVGRDFPGDSAVRSTVLVMGANHNFFNTQWTPGRSVAFAEDDWRDPGDPVCGPGRPTRLSAAQQRRVAATYVAGGVRLVAERDDRVLPMFDGSAVRVPSAGEADVRSTAVGGRRDLVAVQPGLVVRTSGGLQARVCRGQSSGPSGVCGAGLAPERTPHWPLGDQPPYRPGKAALAMSWTVAGGRADLTLPEPMDLSGSATVDARVIVGTGTPRVRLGLRLTDAAGASVLLDPRRRGRLDAYPGAAPLGKLIAQTLRAPLAGVTGVDLSGITRIGLVAGTERGRVWLLDLAGRRRGLAAGADVDVPVVRVLDVDQSEGSESDRQRVLVTLRADRDPPAPTRLLARAVEPTSGQLLRRTSVLLEPGQRRVRFAVPWERDDRDDFPDATGFDALVFSASGTVVTGDYAGRATVRDDDPSPAVSVERLAGTVPEGTRLRWRLRLSEPADYFAGFFWEVVRADGDAPQLRTNDVPASWLRSMGVQPPARPVPLWRVDGLGGVIGLEPGQDTEVVSIPTVADERAEGREVVALRFRGGEPLPLDPVDRVAGVRDGDG